MDSFESKVNQQIEKLQMHSCREIEAETARKRIAWCQQHPGRAAVTPRDAFERLFFEYMGLSAEDLPVVEENEERIVWLSKNPCPTLAACSQIGLDARTICRAAYEKSTQAFISQLDPQLRFSRSYTEIRPYADHCLERITRVDFNAMMRIAIQEARISRQEGNKGYGAVVVLAGEVVARAHDTAVTAGDPSQHAEVNAIRQAVQASGDANLCGALLFSTCEPCPMCSSLAVWANVTSIVYGASIEKTARMGKSRIQVSAREIVNKSPVMIEVIGGVLEEEYLALYR
jgi:tRNA(Arg) A34 adenosine deaminase TadA